jgi:RNA polymerase sigma-70 factor (ECF subfamily)
MTLDAAIVERADELADAFADPTAFRRWYDVAAPRVYSYLIARTGEITLAEELTQQTFVAAIDQRHRFDGRADSVTWLCGIAKHKLADHFRRLEREHRRQIRIELGTVTTGDPEIPWRTSEQRTEIQRILAELPPAQRAALLFADLDGLPVAEIGRLLGRSTGAAQSLITRARENFRERYRGEASDG